MSYKYKFHNPDGVYFVSFAVHGWILDYLSVPGYKLFLVFNPILNNP